MRINLGGSANLAMNSRLMGFNGPRGLSQRRRPRCGPRSRKHK